MWLPVRTGGSADSAGQVPTTLPISSMSTRRPRSCIHITTRSRPSRSSSVSARRAQPPPSIAPISASASRRPRKRGIEMRKSSTLFMRLRPSALHRPRNRVRAIRAPGSAPDCSRRPERARDVAWAYRDARAGRAARGADRGDDRRRRRDRRRLAYALGTERRAGLRLLDQRRFDGWRVERGRDQVVGEARVAHQPVVDDQLFHHREPETLRDAALDLAGHLQGVQHSSDVLRGGQVYHPNETELGVDVDHRPVRRAGERHVRVALAVGVEGVREPVLELRGHVDRFDAGELGDRVGVERFATGPAFELGACAPTRFFHRATGPPLWPWAYMRFLKPTAKPTPRATSRASAVRPAPPGRPIASSNTTAGNGSAAHARITSATGKTPSIRWPVISSSPGPSALRSRSSTGSISHAAASLSICDSCAKHDCTTPNPRIAPHGGLLVRTAIARTCAFGTRYGPAAKHAAFAVTG